MDGCYINYVVGSNLETRLISIEDYHIPVGVVPFLGPFTGKRPQPRGDGKEKTLNRLSPY